MELNQLRYFQKVARTQSVTKAAKELYISQPTLSQSLRRLETSVGVPLFHHQPGKRLELNDAGLLFLERVDRMFAELEQGVNLVRELKDRANVQISIASSIHDLCNDLIIAYFEKNPRASIAQRLVEINTLTDLLVSDEIDFAISPCPLTDPRVESRPLYTEELMVVVGPGHRLYGRKSVSKEELLEERFVLNYSESDRNYLDELYQNEGRTFRVALESNEPSVIRQAVEKGVGVAFRPVRLVMRRRTELNTPENNWAIRIRDYSFDAPTCISKKKGRFLMQSASEFYEFVIGFCQAESELAQAFLEEYPL